MVCWEGGLYTFCFLDLVHSCWTAYSWEWQERWEKNMVPSELNHGPNSQVWSTSSSTCPCEMNHVWPCVFEEIWSKRYLPFQKSLLIKVTLRQKVRQLLDKNRSGELQCASAEVDCGSRSAIGRLIQSAFLYPSTISMLHSWQGEGDRVCLYLETEHCFHAEWSWVQPDLSPDLTQLYGERVGYTKLYELRLFFWEIKVHVQNVKIDF